MMARVISGSLKPLFNKAACALLAAILIVSLSIPFASLLPQKAEAAGLVIGIDIGHGTDPDTGAYDPGACANGLREYDVNAVIANALAEELRTYDGVTVVFSGEYVTETNTPRKQRIDSLLNQGAQVIISVHNNSAGDPNVNGSEVWAPNNSPYNYDATYVVGQNLGKSILKQLEEIGMNNRGVFTRNSSDTDYPNDQGIADYLGINYWSRLNGVCGIIVEHAYLTGNSDSTALKDPSRLKAMGIADATGIANYYGLVKRSEGGNGNNGGNPNNATSNPNVYKTEQIASTPLPDDALTYVNSPIMGQASVSAAQMAAFYKTKRTTWAHDYSEYGARSIEEFCQILCEEAAAEGVRPEVVFAQAMIETGWLDFGGMVEWNQCNFCGLGALDGSGDKHVADFGVVKDGNGTVIEGAKNPDGVRMGLRAQVQHLKAYGDPTASTSTLAHPCVDPRFDLVSPKGKAPNVQGLSGTWASDPDYGNKIQNILNQLINGTQGTAEKDIVPGDITISINASDILDASSSLQATDIYLDGNKVNATVSNGKMSFTVERSTAHVITAYEYNSTSSDTHTVYPTRMYGWILEPNAQEGTYTVKRYHALDDLLIYAGSSIRVTGNKGIRMITSIFDNTKSALTSSGVDGWKIKETGTLIAWADNAPNGNLTTSTSGVVRGTAYVAGSKDPVFSQENGRNSFTNVMLLPSSADASVLKRDLAMRPYAVLVDSSGNETMVYGGTLYRSVQYIAQQNQNAFAAGTNAYNYIQGILNACA